MKKTTAARAAKYAANVVEILRKAAALDAFMKANVEILDLLHDLTEIADEHFDLTPDEITWANVGDVTETRNALQAISDRIKGEGEYAAAAEGN